MLILAVLCAATGLMVYMYTFRIAVMRLLRRVVVFILFVRSVMSKQEEALRRMRLTRAHLMTNQ